MKSIYLIKDLARASGTSIYTIKYYYKLGLLQECGRSPETDFRYFNESTVERLHWIRHHRKMGHSIASIRSQLKSLPEDEK